MNILVLGGTSFVGRYIVEDLLARGHTPTLFNRGKTGIDLFPGVERLVGDRSTGDYAALDGRRWDAVVDVTAYIPRHVEQVIAALGDHSGRYLLMSSGMVYDLVAAGGSITETSPRLPPEHDTEEITDHSYGPLKVACEDTLMAQFGDRLTVVRPGWVVGPHEKGDLLTYWTRRTEGGDPIAVPERVARPVQLLDVRDLARLVALLLEQDRSGAYNAVGPASPLTFVELVKACGDVELVPVAEDGIDFPLLFPDPAWDVMFRISGAAASAVGMSHRPLAQTIADTRAWDGERGRPTLVSGMSVEEEQALLAASS